MNKYLKIGIVVIGVLTLVAGSLLAGWHRAQRDAWLGVMNESVDYDLVERYDLSVKYGAFIRSVYTGSPADDAGLEDEDVIIAIDGEKVTDSHDLSDIIEEHDSGDEVTLTVIRDGEEMEFKATLEEGRKARRFYWNAKDRFDDRAHGYSYGYSHGHNDAYIGVSLMNLSRQLGDYFGAERGRGALIKAVDEDSPAAEAGLMAGDVIIAIDGDGITDAEDVVDEIGDRDPGEKITVKVLRNKQEQQFEVEIDEKDYNPWYGEYYYEGDESDFPLIYSIPDIPAIPAIPAIPEIPRVHGLRYGHYSDYDDYDFDFDAEEFQEEMEELREELQELQREMKDEFKELRLKLD